MKLQESVSVSINVYFLLFGGAFADWWIKDTKFNDHLPLSLPASALRVPKLKCAILCKADTTCKGFFFNVDTNDCLLTSSVHLDNGNVRAAAGYRYYRSKPFTCPSDGIFVVHEQSARCFELIHEAKNWQGARDACFSNYGRLAVLDSAEKENALLDSFRSRFLNVSFRFHIGGYRPYDAWNSAWPNGVADFSWLNGQPVTSLDFWGSDEPNNANAHENIMIIIYSVLDGWVEADSNATDEHSYICDFALL